MRSGLLPVRVVHLHPTRTCNLACAHCYSTSAPSVRGALGVVELRHALARLREEGYENVSISGGEPLVYRDLDRLAAHAVELGYRVHMITNGLLLSPERLRSLRQHVDFIGVSLDGCEETHNAVRGRADAHRRAMRALELLAEHGVPFGIIFGVSARSLGDVPWAFERARELRARLLHLRPLAPEGRAQTLPDTWTLTHEDCARLVVLGELLDGFGPEALRVQVDLVSTTDLPLAREQFDLLRDPPTVTRLSDAVNPLVIDDEGRCLPFAYGTDASFEVARVSAADGDAFRPRGPWLERVAELLRTAFHEAERTEAPYLDWFAHLARISRAMGEASPAAAGAESAQ